jgi:hypothetical protein
VRIEAHALVALDAAGAEVWRYAIPPGERYRAARFHLVDFDRIGRPDVVVLLTQQPLPTSNSDVLLRFSQDGDLRWSFRPSARLAFGPVSYGAPWFAEALTSLRIGGETRLLFAVRHVTWWPSMLLTLDQNGRPLGTFVNAGWIQEVAVAGDRIVISGVSNGADAGMVAVLDARNPSGRSPEDPSSAFFCASCPPGAPLQYLTFGRSEINRAGGYDINRALALVFDRAIEVHTQEANATSSEAIYDFTFDFALTRARFGDRYWEQHRRLEHEGRFSHTAEQCRMRDPSALMRVWTPLRGWEDGPVSYSARR